jgi:hypothetical protein
MGDPRRSARTKSCRRAPAFPRWREPDSNRRPPGCDPGWHPAKSAQKISISSAFVIQSPRSRIADARAYPAITLGFRHSPRLVPESKRVLRRRGERPHSSAGRTSERPGLLHAGERVRARITRRPPAVMLAEERPRVRRSRGCRTRSSRVGKEQWSTARDVSRDLATTQQALGPTGR